MTRFTTLLAAVVAFAGAAAAHEKPKPGPGHGPEPPCHSNTGMTQMVTYVKRHPSYTRQEYWDYWKTQHAPKVVPLATYFNITRYQQIQVGGQILPFEAGAEKANSTEPVEFDGIATFLYEDPDSLTAMLAHPYYTEVIAKDEAKFIDKSAFGAGMVATFVGKNIENVDAGKDTWVGDEKTRKYYQKMFESYL